MLRMNANSFCPSPTLLISLPLLLPLLPQPASFFSRSPWHILSPHLSQHIKLLVLSPASHTTLLPCQAQVSQGARLQPATQEESCRCTTPWPLGFALLPHSCPPQLGRSAFEPTALNLLHTLILLSNDSPLKYLPLARNKRS